MGLVYFERRETVIAGAMLVVITLAFAAAAAALYWLAVKLITSGGTFATPPG